MIVMNLGVGGNKNGSGRAEGAADPPPGCIFALAFYDVK